MILGILSNCNTFNTLGWVLQWTSPNSGVKINQFFGLLNMISTYSLTAFQITSTGPTLSILWQGVVGNIEVSVITSLGQNDLHFITTVKLRNVGLSTLTDVYCKCCDEHLL